MCIAGRLHPTPGYNQPRVDNDTIVYYCVTPPPVIEAIILLYYCVLLSSQVVMITLKNYLV